MRSIFMPLVVVAAALAGCQGTTSPVQAANDAAVRALALPRLHDVSDADYQPLAGRPDCSVYTVTGSVDGGRRVVRGVACRQPDGDVSVREKAPSGPDIVATIAPPAWAGPQPDLDGDYGPYDYDDLWAWDYPFGLGFGFGLFDEPFFRHVDHRGGFRHFAAMHGPMGFHHGGGRR